MKVTLISILISISALTAINRNIIPNGDFEMDADGDGMADHWRFAGDKGVSVTWGRDKGFTGRFSQKLTCTRFTYLSPASHAMLCQVNTVRLERGRWYKLSFAAKQEGIRTRAVHVAIVNMRYWRDCGLKESFRVPRKWKRFDFTFRATETIADNVRLQFWYTSTGTLWLDDVRLEPSKPVVRRFTEAVSPTGAVNLIPNSSFECGTSGWGSIADLPGWGGNLNLIVGEVDNTTSLLQGSSFKIALAPETLPLFHFDYFPLYRVPVKAPLLANRGWIDVERGADYTLSAYIKADTDGLVGVLSVRQAFRGTLRREVRLTTEWKRYTFTFRPQAGQIFIALGLDLEKSNREAGTVWIDGVQLERGSKATPYRPRATVEAGLKTGRLGNIFPYGAEPEMEVALFNYDKLPHTVTLHLRITDFDDAVVHRDLLTIEVPPGETVRIPVRPGVRRKGFYRLHLSAEGAEVALTRSLRFAIIEPYAETDSPFGMNHAYPWPHLLDLSGKIGIRWFRDWSLKWQEVEPEKGRFEFKEADHQIDRVLGRGLNVLALLPFPSSNWSSSAGTEVKVSGRYPGSRERMAYMPRDLEEFADYVRETVRHYRDRIHAWEILNEPIHTSYALPRQKGYKVEEYVQLLKVAYRAVKEVQPDSLVIGGIAGGPDLYTREFVESGGLRWVDALNLHIYPGLTAPEEYEEPLSRLRRLMRSAGADKPIWLTEGAYYADDDKPFEPYKAWLKPLEGEAEAAEWQVKFNTILLAYGVKRIFYHSGTSGSLNDESLSGIFFEWGGTPRKMLATQAAMANLLGSEARPLGRVEAPEGVRAYGFFTEKGTLIVAWREEDAAPVEITLSEPWKAVDIQGNQLEVNRVKLTERPLYLVARGKYLERAPW